MSITCCKDCAKRHIGCHSECEDYKSQKQAFEQHKEKRLFTVAQEKRVESISQRRKKWQKN